MPNLDGIGLVDRLRASGDYADRPIFVVTRGADGDEKERIRAAGATAWIVKPFDTTKLLNAIRKVISNPQPMGLARTVNPNRQANSQLTYI